MTKFCTRHLGQKFQNLLLRNKKILQAESGQTFIEFLFLLLILIGLSFGLVRGFNGSVGKKWSAVVQAIARPNTTDNFEL